MKNKLLISHQLIHIKNLIQSSSLNQLQKIFNHKKRSQEVNQIKSVNPVQRKVKKK